MPAISRSPLSIGCPTSLTAAEWAALRSQIVTLKRGRGQHRKYLPYAFTEQGVAMLSSALKSARAIAVNIQIMRAFVRMRELLISNRELAQKLDQLEARLEKKLASHDEAITAILSAIHELSAGKRRSTRLRQGAPWLKTALVTVAWGAVRTKNSHLQAQFHRLRARRGAKKAIVAVAASMLTAASNGSHLSAIPSPGTGALIEPEWPSDTESVSGAMVVATIAERRIQSTRC